MTDRDDPTVPHRVDPAATDAFHDAVAAADSQRELLRRYDVHASVDTLVDILRFNPRSDTVSRCVIELAMALAIVGCESYYARRIALDDIDRARLWDAYWSGAKK